MFLREFARCPSAGILTHRRLRRFDKLYREGKIEFELVPQGNLAARIEAAGAGLGAIFTPVGVGTQLILLC